MISLRIIKNQWRDFVILSYSYSFPKHNMDSKSQYDAGKISGQTKEKTSNLIEKADKNVQHVKENVQQGGQQMLAKAKGATEGAKDATGVNK
ncbi:hypothetical protein L1987_34386 [Smallanthus sonchifolius]|uniref:Uncharacterized protein n=1 Tax=Smallanthus sonchifolius TaxID=185202 RepID=A0ACB9HUX0_9ASTR|nr:hypothetical protein L1987_34386 [Smallanthus sonchifolius]